MPKYIKKEMADLNGKGSPQAFYSLQTLRLLSQEEFAERVHSFNGAFSKSVILGVLVAVRDQMVWEIANGYKVQIEGLGIFGCKLGVKPDKEMDGFEEGKRKRNAQSIEVNGITFRADKSMIKDVNRNCDLERGGENRLHHSEYTPKERLSRAKKYLKENGIMHVADYAALTGLSYTTASRELRKLVKEPFSGITSRGRKSAKVYLLG